MKAGPDYADPAQVTEYRNRAAAMLPATATQRQIQEKADELMYYSPYQNFGDPKANAGLGDHDNQVYTKMLRGLQGRVNNPKKFGETD